MSDETPEQAEEPNPPRQRAPRRSLSRDQAHIALGMKVAGLSIGKISTAMPGSTQSQVYRALQKIPDAKEQIDVMREHLRLRKMKSIFDADEMLWLRIQNDIPEGEAKDIDALFRAAHASEKMAQSIAGEAQKVDVTGAPAPNVDLKILIQALGLEGLKELGG